MSLAGQLLRVFLLALSLCWAGFLGYTVAAEQMGWQRLPHRTTLALLAGVAGLLVAGAIALLIISRRSQAAAADILLAIAGPQAGKRQKRLIRGLGDDLHARTVKAGGELADAWDVFADSDASLMVWRPKDDIGCLMIADMPWLAELPWPPRQPQALALPELPVDAWEELGVFAQGLIALHAGEAEQALTTWGALQSLADTSAIWQGLAWESLENLETARDWYTSSDTAEARFNLARCHTLLGETDEAIVLWNGVLAAEPGCGAASYWLGTIYRDLGRPQDAVNILQPASDDDAPACWALAGDILGDVGVWGLAVTAYKQALDQADDDSELWRRYGKALEQQGRMREAIEATEHSVNLEPTAANMTQWGHQLGQMGEWEAALPLFERANELDDEYPEAIYRWAQAKEDLCRFDESIGLYERLLMLHPMYTAARLSLASLHARLGNLAAASVQFGQALAAHPHPTEVHLRWGIALAQGGAWQEALSHLEAVIGLDPRSSVAYHYLGLALMQLKRGADALRFFRRSYELDGANVQVLIDWGIALGSLGHFDKALARFKAALIQAPRHPRALYNLGVALDKLGEHEEAAEAFGQVVVVSPEDAQAHADLGRALNKLGRTDEAIAHTQHANRLLEAAGSPTP
ncbi:MAG: tetratricopeptide repeat protein [Candidatus Sericytochromatia bacterium]|nr:tetratricopeptide repeat protein [Candidatus Sericytochromatia bacterium]